MCADKSKIEWTDATWNPVRGCSVVSEGCRNCYAMQVAARFNAAGQAYEGLAYRNEAGAHWTGEVRLIEEHLEDPLRWKRPRRIFLNSMSDLFHESIPDEWVDRIFAVMALAPRHQFQVLTKRPARMCDYFSNLENRMDAIGQQAYDCFGKMLSGDATTEDFVQFNLPLFNTWLGVSCEDQKTADERIPLLLETPASIKWVSAEPLLGPVDLSRYMASGYLTPPHDDVIDWVVVGGESGPGARPMRPDWARSLRDQCVAAGVSFFFKQGGEYVTQPRGDCGHPSSDGAQGPVRLLNPMTVDVWRCGICNALHTDEGDFARVGKKAAGRLLDGREWNEYPDTVAGLPSPVATAEVPA